MYPWLIDIAVWQKATMCKAVILQLKFLKRKEM